MSITWLPFGKTYGELRDELKWDVVGVQVTIDGRDFLIGNTDDQGGDTGYLPVFDSMSVVTRYRRVWSEE